MNVQDARSPGAARRSGLAARRALSAVERRRRSLAVVRRLLELPELATAGRAAWYLALHEEVDLSEAVDPLRSRGWTLHLPRIAPAGEAATMVLVEWRPGARIVPNRFGVGEVEGPPVPVGGMDVVIVPCVAVDRHGTRVGFGAGYYDRALAAAPSPARIGVAFEVQSMPRIERREWDVPMDLVVTDAAVRRRPRAG